MVNVMGDEVTVVISDGCPSEAHVLVVVQEVGVGRPRPLASYSVEELMMLTMEYSSQRQRRQLPPSTVYIAANLTRGTVSVCLIHMSPGGHSLRHQFPIPTGRW